MTEERSKGEFMGAYYVGKEFVKKGTKKDKEGNEVEWKLYTALFKRSLEDQFPVRMSGFNNVVDELEEGEYYNVGYNLSEPKYNEKAKKAIQYKSLFFAKKAEPGSVSESASAPAKSVAKSYSVDDVKEFEKEYDSSGIEDDSHDKFMLTWFLNHHEEEYDLVHAYAKKRYE